MNVQPLTRSNMAKALFLEFQAQNVRDVNHLHEIGWPAMPLVPEATLWTQAYNIVDIVIPVVEAQS